MTPIQTLALVLVVALVLDVGLLYWIHAAQAERAGTIKPGARVIRWLPRPPTYFHICLFGAAWNAIYVRSLPATIFCLALGGVFKLAEEWTEAEKTAAVVLGGISILVADVVWFVTRSH